MWKRLGNVQWWSLVSQYTLDQLVKTMHCEVETRGCCAVSMWDITRDLVLRFPHARWSEERNENCKNDGTREMGSRVQSNVCWSSLAIETGSTESGEPCCTEAEAEQGVAPVSVMPAVPKVHRRGYVTKRDLVKYGMGSGKHARSWRQACTMRRFLTTTDAEIALASSWRKTATRDMLSE